MASNYAKFHTAEDSDSGIDFRFEDDSWYLVRLVLVDESLIIKYYEFGEDHDDYYGVSNFKSLNEIRDFEKRFQITTKQLQDYECRKVIEGMAVCASHKFAQDDVRFYDAIVEEVCYNLHKRDQCTCRFLLFWQTGPNAGKKTFASVENICLHQPQRAEIDPTLTLFLNMCRKKFEAGLGNDDTTSKDNPTRYAFLNKLRPSHGKPNACPSEVNNFTDQHKCKEEENSPKKRRRLVKAVEKTPVVVCTGASESKQRNLTGLQVDHPKEMSPYSKVNNTTVNGMINIDGTRVLASYAELYKKVVKHFGHLRSKKFPRGLEFTVSASLHQILLLVQEMEYLDLQNLSQEKLDIWEAVISYAEMMEYNIGWLRKYLEVLKAHFVQRARVDELKEAAQKKKSELAVVKAEVLKLKKQYDALRGYLDLIYQESHSIQKACINSTIFAGLDLFSLSKRLQQ